MRGSRVEQLLPGLAVARQYEASWWRADVTAGLALVALAIPAGMGYAAAAGLPPVVGLYATIVPMLVYAVVGPSRVLVLGPDSALVPMIGAAVLPLAAGDADRAVALAGLLSVMIGVILLAARVLRLGFVTGLLSKPIRVGYLNGIALVIIISQLPKVFGFSVPSGSVVAMVREIVDAVRDGAVSFPATWVGLGSLAVLVVAKVLRSKVPGTVLAVLGAGVLTAVLGLEDAVPVVGVLPQGFPPPALSGVTAADVVPLLAPAAAIAVIAFADTGVLSRTLANRRGEAVDGNREMGALGVANVASGLFGGIPVAGSATRTPVVLEAGARTQVSGIVAAFAIIGFMALAPGLPAYLPSSTLAAVVIVAASSFVDLATPRRLFAMSRTESTLLVVTFLGVAFIGVLEGIAIAIALSVAAFVRRAWDPYRAELADVDGMPGYHDLARHPEGRRVPGLLIVRFDAPLFFANGELFGSFVRSKVRDADEPVRWVLVAAEPITGIDTTALDDLIELDEHLRRHDITLVFAEMKGPVKDRMARYGAGERFGPDRFFPTVNKAVKAFRHEPEESPAPPEESPAPPEVSRG